MTKDCIWRDHEGERNIPLTDFPRNAQRKDGLNPYCKSCCRRIVYSQRQAIREIEMARRLSLGRGIVPPKFKQTPELRVLKAIKGGARTQPEIARQAKLPFDELGLVLVKLMIEEKKVASRIESDERTYFLREAAA